MMFGASLYNISKAAYVNKDKNRQDNKFMAHVVRSHQQLQVKYNGNQLNA